MAIVTGAAKGIGRAIAMTLAGQGAFVIAADIDADAGEAAGAELRAISARSSFQRVDIADRTQVLAAVDCVAHKFGRIDILVNNAAVTRRIGFFELKAEEVDWIIDVNVKGTLAMTQAVARVMRERQAGRIVNLSSIAGKGYRYTSSIAYAASKGALIAMTRVAAAQLGPYGITVNAVCPGLTETELMSGWLEASAAERGKPKQALIEELLSASALGRANTPLDVAAAVLFLVSDGARNITGQSLNIDGGTMWD